MNSLIYNFLWILLINFIKADEILPECEFIDSVLEMEKWWSFDRKTCTIKNQTKPSPEQKDLYKIYENGLKNYAFNSFVSDFIGPNRENGPLKGLKSCEPIEYKNIHIKASIVIVFHNEAFSVLVRMLNGIFDRTPKTLLHEIILYNDESTLDIDENLKKLIKLTDWPTDKIKFFKSTRREGLIRSRILASREASGEVLIFLDSHCEVNKRWIEPLLESIQNNSTNVLLPIVDLIDPNTFEYTEAMVSKGSFDWALKFNWDYFPWEYFDIPENKVKPFKTVAMSGGLLAIDRNYFKKLGEYDYDMEIWGAENIDLSIRIWLCGGQILTHPCSRVGHVFRMRRPYVGKPGVDTNLFNSLRTASVWFDEYKVVCY